MIKKIFKTLILFTAIAVIVISAGLALLNYLLMPAIDKKVRQIVAANLGKGAEVSQVTIKLPEVIVFVKGLKIADSNLKNYNYTASVDEATLRISLIGTFLQKRILFDKVYIKNTVFVLEKKNLSQSSDVSSAGALVPDTAVPETTKVPPPGEKQFNELYIRKLLMENMEFIFKDYSTAQQPAVIEVVNISGEIDNFLMSFCTAGNFKAAIHFTGWFNSTQEGSLKVGGTIVRRGNEIDFDLKSEIHDVDLTYFSQYYTNTSFTILKKARVDITSDAKCRKNELATYHDVRIHGIELDDMAPTSQDMLFGLPATTVTNFFNDYGGEVKFNFNIGGTLNDPKFEPGPIVKDVMSKALGDKIAARFRELPRDVVKISEKAINGDIDIGKESKIWLDEMGKKFEDMKKELKKKHDADNVAQ